MSKNDDNGGCADVACGCVVLVLIIVALPWLWWIFKRGWGLE